MRLLFTLLIDFLLLFLLATAASNDGNFTNSSQMVVISIIFLLMIESPELFGLCNGPTRKQPQSPHHIRKRRGL
jgi:hypothetical protein